jgi:hypothetical protein
MANIDNLSTAFALLEKYKDLVVCSSGEKKEDLIEEAQIYLGVYFPISYKMFLRKFGFISLGGCEIYGVIDSDFINSTVPDAIWFSYDNRQYGLPHYMLQIYSVGEGTTYCLDTSQMNSEGECPVVAWPLGGYETTPVLEIVAPDFGTFFLNLVKREIEWKKEREDGLSTST